MKTYKDFAPTGLDSRGLNADVYDIGEWLVVCGRNRDSGLLEESNFAMALQRLGGESESVQVHSFGHWACGWFEILLVNPCDADKRTIAEAIENSLADYPVLDESDYSARQWNAACESWARMSVRYRAELIGRKSRSVSMFAARRNELPENDDNGAILDYLAD